MTEERKRDGASGDAQKRRRGEGEQRPGRERGDRRSRGRRRRGTAKEPAEGRSRQPKPQPQKEEQLPPGTLVAFLARAGIGSRRRCDEIIRAGRVTVNDAAVDFPRHKVGPEDVVAVDGAEVAMRPLRYVLLNKPRGMASTRSDPHAERLVVDLVPDGRTLFPVGRLDVDTTGLLVLTNDGPLAHRLMHPSYGVPKTYVARVRGRVGKQDIAALRSGIELDDGMTAPAEARLLKQSGKSALVELTIHQGRKRQVRRMFASLGLPVDELQRRRYGPLSDANLAAGKWRELSADEVDALRRAAEHVEVCVDREPEEHAVTLAAEERPAPPAATPADAGAVEEPPDAGAAGAEEPAEAGRETGEEESEEGGAAATETGLEADDEHAEAGSDADEEPPSLEEDAEQQSPSA